VWEGGGGPTVTLLHGYPGSSYDWNLVAPDLAARFRVIAPDLLGYGQSAKPFPYPYSIREQADVVQQVWSELGVSRTALVAHDYSVSIAQELLRRGATGITSVTFLNGGIYPRLHRPTDGQLALLSPDGDALAALIDKDIWTQALAATFGSKHPLTTEEADDLWAAFSHDDGSRLAAALLHYIADRKTNGEAWIAAMESMSVPTSFIWGPEDPVSGEHMIAEAERRMTTTPITRLAGVGHWPMLEDPAGVAAALSRYVG
jgi:pimeloyl-ACP methyl ester carboxylesterase